VLPAGSNVNKGATVYQLKVSLLLPDHGLLHVSLIEISQAVIYGLTL